MSSGGGLELDQGAVATGVVGLLVLPAAPDDLGPGPGEDPFRVGVSLALRSELLVSVGGPLVAVA